MYLGGNRRWMPLKLAYKTINTALSKTKCSMLVTVRRQVPAILMDSNS